MNNVGMVMRFLSGRKIDLNDLNTIQNLTVEDIALSLARENRFYGQTRKGPYSVGQHVILANTLYKLECEQTNKIQNFFDCGQEILHHDDPEVITRDIPKQVKLWLGDFYFQKEKLLTEQFCKLFALKTDENTSRIVKTYDEMALNYELSFFTHQYEKRDDLPLKKFVITEDFAEIWGETKTMDRYLELHYRLENARKPKISI